MREDRTDIQERDPVLPDAGDLLQPAVRCPTCGARPALRISLLAAGDATRHDPDERLGTYKCHRRKCGVVYDLRAEAYQRAE